MPTVLSTVVKGFLSNGVSGASHAVACKAGRPTFGSGPSGVWVLLFVLSKAFELLDTVFLIVSGTEVKWLHYWHHLSVLPWAWTQYASGSSPCGAFAAMNLCVHAVMYAYFGEPRVQREKTNNR